MLDDTFKWFGGTFFFSRFFTKLMVIRIHTKMSRIPDNGLNLVFRLRIGFNGDTYPGQTLSL